MMVWNEVKIAVFRDVAPCGLSRKCFSLDAAIFVNTRTFSISVGNEYRKLRSVKLGSKITAYRRKEVGGLIEIAALNGDLLP
jgi:hypothetical protein